MKLLTRDVAMQLSPDEIIRLGYKAYNEGEFLWMHISTQLTPESHIQCRLTGYFSYESQKAYEMVNWSGPQDFLYEFQGCICRGSGAEPCWILEEGETSSDISRYAGWTDKEGDVYTPKDPHEA